MTVAIIVGQFVVIVLLSVGWWREIEEVGALSRQLVALRDEVLGRTSEMRMLEEENRIIINEIVSSIDTQQKIMPQPEEQARRSN